MISGFYVTKIGQRDKDKEKKCEILDFKITLNYLEVA